MTKEIITHYPHSGQALHAANGVTWEVDLFRCSGCGREMAEVTPDFEQPVHPRCITCRVEPLPVHLGSQLIVEETEA